MFVVISGSSSIKVKDEQSGKEYALSSHNISAASINSLNMAMILLFMTFILSTLIMWWGFSEKQICIKCHCICCTIIIYEHRALHDSSSILCKLVTGGSSLKKKSERCLVLFHPRATLPGWCIKLSTESVIFIFLYFLCCNLFIYIYPC